MLDFNGASGRHTVNLYCTAIRRFCGSKGALLFGGTCVQCKLKGRIIFCNIAILFSCEENECLVAMKPIDGAPRASRKEAQKARAKGVAWYGYFRSADLQCLVNHVNDHR